MTIIAKNDDRVGSAKTANALIALIVDFPCPVAGATHGEADISFALRVH